MQKLPESGAQEWKRLRKRAIRKLGFLRREFSIPRETPLVWSFKVKDLAGGSGQVFEE